MGVVPGAGPPVALESEDCGLPVLHGLIQIHFDICDLGGVAAEIDIGVVEKIRGGVVVPEGRIEALGP